jgi:hypothetical protein
MSDHSVGWFETGWRVFTWSWDHKAEIGRKLGNLFAWFRGGNRAEKGTPGILVIGPGGVGKTTLGRVLSGGLADSLGRYDESLNVERFPLEDNPGVEIVVPPGQLHRRESTWQEVRNDICAGKFRGIIVVLAYGYHSLGYRSYKEHRLYQGNKRRFLDAYLNDRRTDELNVLRQLIPSASVSPGKLWMLTLVTKQDLWWPKREEVARHYREGSYAVEIERLSAQRDLREFRHEFAFASLVIGNFQTGRGEMLQKNVAGYDAHLQNDSERLLFETLDALKNWEVAP